MEDGNQEVSKSSLSSQKVVDSIDELVMFTIVVPIEAWSFWSKPVLPRLYSSCRIFGEGLKY